jgi:diacylglycerol kinase (ATP)
MVRPASETDLKDPNLESIPPVAAYPTVGGSIVGSFRAAIAGVLRTIAAQRNMKIHVVSALMVLIVGMALPLDLVARVALLFAIAIVFFAEILNTALEAFVDLHIRDYHRLAMMAKDAAAAGVLVLAVTTVIVLAEILTTQWHLVTDNLDDVQRSVVFGVPMVILEAMGLFVLRRGPLAVVRLLASLALFVPLALHTEDPIFAALAVVLVLVAGYARWSFPRMAGRGAPRTMGVP